MLNKKITVIGIGNMGSAISLALLNKKIVLRDNLILSNRTLKNTNYWNKLKINYINDNVKAIKETDIIILAVKPQEIISVLQEIKKSIKHNQLLISIAAGIQISKIENIIGKNQPIVRAVPNICIKVNQSMTCWVKNDKVTTNHIKFIKTIFKTLGKEIQIDKEKLLNVITAISGCGPAYLFFLIEMMITKAIELGINKDISKILVIQTIVGSLRLLQKSKSEAFDLRKSVASKGGMTEAAFQVLYKNNFQEIFTKAIQASINKADNING